MIYKQPFLKFFIWLFIAFVISFVGITGVFADTVTLNGSVLDSTNYIVLSSGNRTLTFNGDTVYPDITDFPQYYLLTFCADNDKVNAWYVNNNTLNTVNIYDTSFNCSFPNSSYSGGHIVYVYGKYNPTYQCNSSLMNCASNGSLTFNNPSSSSWALLSYQNSNENISIDYASNSIISQNQDIINQNQQIIQQNQQNTQDIINNNDTNTNKIIENDKVCYQYDKNIIVKNGYFLTSSGGEYSNNASGISDYLKINSNSELSIITTIYQDRYACFYNTNKSLISCYNQNGKSGKIDIPNNTEYFRFSYNVESDKPIYKICKSGSQATNDAIEEQKNAINNLDDTLKNDNVDDNGIADAYEDFNDYLDDNSTITQLLTLPITLYTAILNNLNGSCSPFNLGKLYGEDLILPCINISQYLGNTLWSMIDIIISGFAIYSISKKMIKVFNNFSSLREGDVIDD